MQAEDAYGDRRLRGRLQVVSCGMAFSFYTAGHPDTCIVRTGLSKILKAAEAQSFNCVEITEVIAKRILGISYVRVVAHARRIQENAFIHELDPYLCP